jgi:hypothetical protein
MTLACMNAEVSALHSTPESLLAQAGKLAAQGEVLGLLEKGLGCTLA